MIVTGHDALAAGFNIFLAGPIGGVRVGQLGACMSFLGFSPPASMGSFATLKKAFDMDALKEELDKQEEKVKNIDSTEVKPEEISHNLRGAKAEKNSSDSVPGEIQVVKSSSLLAPEEVRGIESFTSGGLFGGKGSLKSVLSDKPRADGKNSAEKDVQDVVETVPSRAAANITVRVDEEYVPPKISGRYEANFERPTTDSPGSSTTTSGGSSLFSLNAIVAHARRIDFQACWHGLQATSRSLGGFMESNRTAVWTSLFLLLFYKFFLV